METQKMSIVDEYSIPNFSITRIFEKIGENEYLEHQFIYDKDYNTEKKKIKMNEVEAKIWFEKWHPNLNACKLIYEDKNVDLLAGYVKYSLYKSADGRFFSLSEKMNDWDYSSLFTVTWLKKDTEKNWLKKYKNRKKI